MDKGSASSFRFVVEALQEIEKAMQAIGAHGGRSLRYAKSLGVLNDLQRRILSSIPDSNELRRMADKLFNDTNNRVGFEVAVRRMLADAAESSKGRDFNEVNEYLNLCMDAIEGKNQNPTIELLVARVDLMIRWKIQGFKQVPWTEFEEDLVDVLQSPMYQDDLIKRFYLAVAQFHLEKITDGHATFALIRRAQALSLRPHEVRAYLIDESGNPRRLQGTLKKSPLNMYFEVPELSEAFPIKGQSPTSGAGSTAHAYIAFTLNGPTAIFSKPDPRDYLLS